MMQSVGVLVVNSECRGIGFEAVQVAGAVGTPPNSLGGTSFQVSEPGNWLANYD